MKQQSTFADVLDAAEQLDVEVQEELICGPQPPPCRPRPPFRFCM